MKIENVIERKQIKDKRNGKCFCCRLFGITYDFLIKIDLNRIGNLRSIQKN